MLKRLPLALLTCILAYSGCSKDPVINKYKTRNVILMVVDGARYTETWGLAGQPFIPHRKAMLAEGVFCNHFYNNGSTTTTSGHVAMLTGVYQMINNGGLELPANPSFFQYWIKEVKGNHTSAWVVATKDKLEVLSDCTAPGWQGLYRPSADCGVAGLGTGYREDSTTFKNAKIILSSYYPRMMIVNFKQPDACGHAADSAGYLQGIMDTDNYIHQLWQFIQSDPHYKDQTTLMVTNDHGRHTAGLLDGFVSHGDNCLGCRHIEFFAIGPDFRKGYTSSIPHEQTDIASTISELMGFQMPSATGKVMTELFH